MLGEYKTESIVICNPKTKIWKISLTVSTKKFGTQNPDLSRGIYELETKIGDWFQKRELNLRLKRNEFQKKIKELREFSQTNSLTIP